MIIYGEIPDSVVYYARSPGSVRRGWLGFDELDIAPPVTATPAFAVDAKSKDGRETAARWAGDGATAQELPNTPIQAVEILTLEKRQEGGRAYKVRLHGVLDGTLYVDMREDVVLDALIASGAKKGGLLAGPFVWGRYETQLRLVRVGSTLYAAMEEAAKRKATKDLGPADYEVGGVYLTRKLEAMLYLGKCDVDYVVETNKAEPYPSRRPAQYGAKSERNVHTWVDLKVYYGKEKEREKIETWAEKWTEQYDPKKATPWACRVVKKPALIRQVGKLDVDFDRYRRAAVAWAVSYVDGQQLTRERAREALLSYLHSAVLAAHVRPAGEPRPNYPEYEAVWASVTP